MGRLTNILTQGYSGNTHNKSRGMEIETTVEAGAGGVHGKVLCLYV